MKDKLEATYSNYSFSSKNIPLTELYQWLLQTDEEHFEKIKDKIFKKGQPPKVIKLLDALRLVARIEPSQSCKNAASCIRSMTASEVLAAAVSFGVTRARSERFVESLCTMTQTVYGVHMPVMLEDDRSACGIMDSPVIRSKTEIYTENGIPDITDLAENGRLTVHEIIQWRTLRTSLASHEEEIIDEGFTAIDFLLNELEVLKKSSNICPQLYEFCPFSGRIENQTVSDHCHQEIQIG